MEKQEWHLWDTNPPKPKQRVVVEFVNMVDGRTWTQEGAIIKGKFWYDDKPRRWIEWPKPPEWEESIE